MQIKILGKFDVEGAEIVGAQFKPGRGMALPTGNTPIGIYIELKKLKLDWGQINIFMLDVNYPQDPSDPESFASFAKSSLSSAISSLKYVAKSYNAAASSNLVANF